MSDPGTTAKERWNLAVRLLSIVATVLTLWWFLRGLDTRRLGDTLNRADLTLLAFAVLLNLAGQLVRAGSWVAMLGPRYRPSAGRLVRYEFAAQSASSISPARAGELLRLWMLRRESVPVAVTSALIVLKKTVGAACLGVMAVSTPFLLPGLPGWVTGFVVAVSVAMVLLLGLLVLVAYRVPASRVPGFLRGMADGMYVLRDRSRFVRAAALIFVGEVIDAAAAYVVLRALHIGLPVAAVVLVLFFIDFSNALPGAPANLGTFEVGAIYCLDMLHVAPDAALAFALLFHAQQVLPQVAAGLPLQLHFLGAQKRQPPAGAEPVPATETGRDGGDTRRIPAHEERP